MPSEINLYNTISRTIEPLKTREGEAFKCYVCGPTIHNFGHIGNFRTYVAVDLLRRTLTLHGYAVNHVMQFTDVDDKTIKGSREAGMPLKQFTEQFRKAFLEDAEQINIQKPDHLPCATDYIPTMVQFIKSLVDKGHAYAADDGSVYFRIGSFPRYGCLCHLDMAGLQHGARIAADEYEKESVGDFVLWKTWTEADGEVFWESPWGRGRPGWHIECSALAREFLGDELDLHAGGVDLRFPHHENELAQSEAANGKTFSRHWFHVEHLLVEGQKMSKRLGNFFTLRDVLAKGYSGRELRYALLSGAHYSKNLNFSWKAIDDARAALQRLDEWRSRLKDFVANGPSVTKQSSAAPDDSHAEKTDHFPSGDVLFKAFCESLAKDLNVSDGLGNIFTAVRESHRALNSGLMSQQTAQGFLDAWAKIDQVLGLGDATESIPDSVNALLEQRKEARARKDFKQSDELRKQIIALGWLVKDGPKGQELIKA